MTQQRCGDPGVSMEDAAKAHQADLAHRPSTGWTASVTGWTAPYRAGLL